MVTMICPNTVVLLDIPIFLTKQYERRNLISGQLVWLLHKNELKFLVHPTTII